MSRAKPEPELGWYQAHFSEIVFPDVYVAELHLGFGISYQAVLHLRGVKLPKVDSPDYREREKHAKLWDFVRVSLQQEQLLECWPLRVRVGERNPAGAFWAQVMFRDAQGWHDLAETLIDRDLVAKS